MKAHRVVSASSLVAYQGNFYSVPLGRIGKKVHLIHHLSDDTLEITSSTGDVLGKHQLVRAGVGLVCRSESDALDLSSAILSSFPPKRPHHKKANIPPSEASLAQAAMLAGEAGEVDLERYERLALSGVRQ